MAKGNMLQGMARGKVGDVVFSRLNGQQISRVRNRNPRNPRTNPQLYQRAIMATIMQAYSAGKEIFDHSFEGKAVGAECQRQFMKLNAKQLRSFIANEINNATPLADQTSRVSAPGVVMAVPNKYRISEGSYVQSLFTADDEEVTFSLPTPETDETVAHYASRVGLVAGDLYTLVGFIIPDGSTNPAYETPGISDARGKVYPCLFGWVRFKVKEGLGSVATALATYGQLFDIEIKEGFNSGISASTSISTYISFQHFYTAGGYGSLGMIRSRMDSNVRSTTDMMVDTMFGSHFGIVTEYILNAWKNGKVEVGDSDLILEGGDI